ncbi:hypothetical protein ABKW25_20945 (plasmid) [Enterobacter hormaechei]
MRSTLLVSNNYYLRVALQSLRGIPGIDTEMFIKNRDNFIKAPVTVILLDFTSITEFATSAVILLAIRRHSPETKVCVIRTSVTSLRYLTVNPNVLATESVSAFLTKIRAAELHPTSLIRSPKNLTPQECRFLSLYLQNHTMRHISAQLNVVIKTAYTVKRNIWKKADIRRDIDIVLFRQAVEMYLSRAYPDLQLNLPDAWRMHGECMEKA